MTTKINYYDRPIFVLTHNYSVKGKSLGINEQNHYLYELTVKNSDNKYILHYFKQNDKKFIFIEHNDEMTVNDCEKLNSLGNTFKKHGYEFECDKIVDKKQTKLVQKLKLVFENEIGDKVVKKGKSEQEKLDVKIEKKKKEIELLLKKRNEMK